MATLHKLTRICRGTFFCITLLLTAYFGFVVFFLPCLIVNCINPFVGRSLIDTIIGFWFMFATAVYELLMNVKVKITGDLSKLELDGSRLTIMNHRTRLDWLFFFSLQARYGRLDRFKIFLKAPLKHVPGAGWSMQSACFLFLRRKLEEDRKQIDKLLKYFDKLKYRTQVLFFPEGTNLTHNTKKFSDMFALQHDLPLLEYVLNPRASGFIHTVQHLQSKSHLKQIVDVSIAYPFNMLENETDILWRDLPREVHFKVKVYNSTNIPTEADTLETWLRQRWLEKEKYLKWFYEEGSRNNNLIADTCVDEAIEKRTRLSMILSIIFWSLLTFLSLLACMQSHLFFWYISMLSVIYTGISTYFGFEEVLIFPTSLRGF